MTYELYEDQIRSVLVLVLVLNKEAVETAVSQLLSKVS